jgi:hypothetical protein
MRWVSGPQHIWGCESRITRTKVVPERGLPIMNIGLVFFSFNEVWKQMDVIKIFYLCHNNEVSVFLKYY